MKFTIALELVECAVTADLPFRAVVADSFYGEDEGFKAGLRQLKLGYVLALKPSPSWLHLEGAVGALWQVAAGAGWQAADAPGAWVKVTRTFRDGHAEIWWALEVRAGPYGPEQAPRAVVVTTDPEHLPDRSTWYLVTNLPAPGSGRAQAAGALPAPALRAVVRLYGLRMWVEQSYKQVKHAVGWSQDQVRSDVAIRRHWALVCCAFSFCWYHQSHMPDSDSLLSVGASNLAAAPTPESTLATATVAGRGKNQQRSPPPSSGVMASSPAGSASVAGAVDHAGALLAWVVACAPTARVAAAV